MQRNWIGRSEGLLVRFALEPSTPPGRTARTRARDLHDPARHPVRRAVHGGRARPSARRGRRADETRSSPPSSRSAGAPAPRRRRSTRPRSSASTPGIRGDRTRSTPSWRLPVYVANFILMEYGTGAIFGCPAHDQRDLDFVNKYGLGDDPGGVPAGRGSGRLRRSRTWPMTATARMINSRFLDGLTIAEPPRRRWPAGSKAEIRGRPPGRRAQGEFPPARLGHLAPALLGLPDPGDPLRGLRRRAGAGGPAAGRAARGRVLRRAGQPARPAPDLEARRLPAMRRRGPARDGHHGHLRGFVLVLRPLHRPVRRRARRPTGPPSIAGCRSTSISAASSTRSCTCSIRASSPAR